MLDWLTQPGEQYSLVDAVPDPILSSLLEEEHALRWLPILCAKGRLIGSGTLLKQLAESGHATLGRTTAQPRTSNYRQSAAAGSGSRIDNPNEVPVLRSVDCNILAQWINGPTPPLLIDARTEEEYLEERLPSARLLDASLLDALPLLDRRTPLAFYCKNGTRSQRAARHCAELGFIDTATLIGGMDAWKRHFSQ